MQEGPDSKLIGWRHRQFSPTRFYAVYATTTRGVAYNVAPGSWAGSAKPEMFAFNGLPEF